MKSMSIRVKCEEMANLKSFLIIAIPFLRIFMQEFGRPSLDSVDSKQETR